MNPTRALLYILSVTIPGAFTYAATPVATTTSLSAIVSGKAVKQTGHGHLVILTAQVEGPSAPLTRGQVQFCDSLAPHCSDLALLGTAQLTANGTATLKLIPGIGERSYRAQFLGTAGQYKPSSSASTPLNVTGTFPSTTTLTETGSGGTYTFTATTMTTGSTVEPTGMAAFSDLSQSVSSQTIAQVPFGSATPGLTLKAGQFIQNLNLNAQQPAFADFNGDGIMDFVLAQGYNEQVFLGKYNGTFTAGAVLGTAKTEEIFVTADFNQDGIADVATTSTGATSVSVYLGKGDGTFQAPLTTAVAAALQFRSADFNHDGLPDLIVSNSGAATVLLLGNGNGTFRSQSLANVYGFSAIIDANNDGNPDLLIQPADGAVAVYLNDGQGNFKESPVTQTGESYVAASVGDFNNDGIPDVATANY